VIDCEATPEVQCFTGSTDSGQCLSGAYQINNSPWICVSYVFTFETRPVMVEHYASERIMNLRHHPVPVQPCQDSAVPPISCTIQHDFPSPFSINTHAVVREIAAALPKTGIADTGS
jgi:hypothetical protein